MFLYKLTFASGKVYIGQTRKTVEQRFRNHAKSANRGSNFPVHAAWRKYGLPSVDVLAQCDDAAALDALEIEAINAANSRVPHGYNLAGGGSNRIIHDNTKAKLASRIISAEWRANLSAAAKARVRGPRSAETRAKMSASAKLAHANDTSDKRSIAIKAGLAARSPEQRSEAARKAWATKRAQEK